MFILLAATSYLVYFYSQLRYETNILAEATIVGCSPNVIPEVINKLFS